MCSFAKICLNIDNFWVMHIWSKELKVAMRCDVQRSATAFGRDHEKGVRIHTPLPICMQFAIACRELQPTIKTIQSSRSSYKLCLSRTLA